jgi:hypothetical protein
MRPNLGEVIAGSDIDCCTLMYISPNTSSCLDIAVVVHFNSLKRFLARSRTPIGMCVVGNCTDCELPHSQSYKGPKTYIHRYLQESTKNSGVLKLLEWVFNGYKPLYHRELFQCWIEFWVRACRRVQRGYI